MPSKIVYVTQPFLPPLEEFHSYLEEIWQSGWLTNNGPFHTKFEDALSTYLGVEHISLFTNGTLALVTALQALRITGEVITTPYSFVATAHSLLWNGAKPVFVDIDPTSFNLNPALIEAAITPQTTAILAVHTYGVPCNVTAIQQIADIYGLKVIYDAAHAFAVKDNGGSILRHGDLSILSFHATKIFNTFEGGAIICPDAKTKRRIDDLKNFGFANETTVVATGINGKMNEVQAAFGLLQLKYIDEIICKRKAIDERYRHAFADLDKICCPTIPADIFWNHAYFPILMSPSLTSRRDALYEYLKGEGIHSRRYFFPLISEFSMYRGFPSAARSNLINATDISNRVLCLPIYPALSTADQDKIIHLIHSWNG